jgi:tyrosyl-tRNA synthetase
MRGAGLEPQVVLTMPILVGLDGTEKMSKSKGNYIAVTDPPGEIFGKVMSIPDALMENYWTLLTDVPLEKVRETLRTAHPREAKEQLARAIATRYYGADAAAQAAEEFRLQFTQKKPPSVITAIRTVHANPGTSHVGIAWLLKETGLAKSNSEAMRKIGVEKALVEFGGNRITDPQFSVVWEVGKSEVLRLGRKYIRVEMR